MDLYQLAGPTATVIASATAAYVTWKFQSKQVEIARIQAETARNKLKFDLFEERHKFYELLCDYMDDVSRTPGSFDDGVLNRIDEKRRKLTPIRWLFGPEVWNWVINDLQNNHIVGLGVAKVEATSLPGQPPDLAKITTFGAAQWAFATSIPAERDALFERYLRLDF